MRDNDVPPLDASRSVQLIGCRYVLDLRDGSGFSEAVVTQSGGGSISLFRHWTASRGCVEAEEGHVGAATESGFFVRRYGESWRCELGSCGLDKVCQIQKE